MSDMVFRTCPKNDLRRLGTVFKQICVHKSLTLLHFALLDFLHQNLGSTD